jgi:hypothetical protein
MKIPYNLLSNTLHCDWVAVPISDKDSTRGLVSVKIQQINGDVFDELWAAISAAEKADNAAQSDASIENRRAVRTAKLQAWETLVDACVLEFGDLGYLRTAVNGKDNNDSSVEAQAIREDFTVNLLGYIKHYQYGTVVDAKKVWALASAPLATPPEATT